MDFGILCGATATVILEGNIARKCYKEEYVGSPLATKEVESLEVAYEAGIPVPGLLTVVYNDDGEIAELVTELIEGRTLDELDQEEYNLAMDKVRRWIKIALRAGLVLDMVELTTIKGNVRVDARGKLWFIDLN